jgi:hypothetical protein
MDAPPLSAFDEFEQVSFRKPHPRAPSSSTYIDIGEFAVADVFGQLFRSDPEKIGRLPEGIEFHIIPPIRRKPVPTRDEFAPRKSDLWNWSVRTEAVPQRSKPVNRSSTPGNGRCRAGCLC